MPCTWMRPDACSRGRSICVMSPVTTTFDPNPSRVRNICICSGDVFCASRSEEHTSELQSHSDLVCRLLLEKKKNEPIGVAADAVYGGGRYVQKLRRAIEAIVAACISRV